MYVVSLGQHQIVNSIVILFITEIDERLYKLARVINPSWVDNMDTVNKGKRVDALNAKVVNLEEEIENLKLKENEKVDALKVKVEKLKGEIEKLMKIAQDQIAKSWNKSNKTTE